jgi:hypothetical protein
MDYLEIQNALKEVLRVGSPTSPIEIRLEMEKRGFRDRQAIRHNLGILEDLGEVYFLKSWYLAPDSRI